MPTVGTPSQTELFARCLCCSDLMQLHCEPLIHSFSLSASLKHGGGFGPLRNISGADKGGGFASGMRLHIGKGSDILVFIALICFTCQLTVGGVQIYLDVVSVNKHNSLVQHKPAVKHVHLVVVLASLIEWNQREHVLEHRQTCMS